MESLEIEENLAWILTIILRLGQPTYPNLV